MDERSARRVLADVELALEGTVVADDVFTQLLAALRERLPFEGACWHLTDPSSGAFMRIGVTGDLPGPFEAALHCELHEDDVVKFSDLHRRPHSVGVLSTATNGRLERSSRFRELHRPQGYGDELRAAFADSFGVWGSVGLFRERSRAWFSKDEAALMSRVSVIAAAALRRAHGGTPAAADAGHLGVLLLDEGNRVESADSTAMRLLEAIGEGPEATNGSPLPGAVHVLARRARTQTRGQGRVKTRAGTWLLLDASRLDRDRVAVVLRPAPAAAVGDVVMAALELTERERQVVDLVVAGHSTAEIASRLFVSPYTVQDHLKAVFDKVGVRSRRELVAHVSR